MPLPHESSAEQQQELKICLSPAGYMKKEIMGICRKIIGLGSGNRRENYFEINLIL